MELKDIGTKELKELNLYPISYFEILKKCFENGCYYKYDFENRRMSTLAANAHRSDFVHRRIELPSNEYEIEKIPLKPFSEVTREELEKFGYSGKSLYKLLWLQKYINGQTSGYYDEFKDENLQSFFETKELVKKNNTINKLTIQLQEEKEKNIQLSEELEELKLKIKTTNKLKEKLQRFLIENQTLFNDFLQELD